MLTLMSVPGTFGALSGELLGSIAGLGFDGVRVDVHPGDGDEHHLLRRAQIETLRDSPSIFALFLIGPHRIDLNREQLVQKTEDFCVKLANASYQSRGNFALEIGNEPDLAVKRWKRHPQTMARAFTACFHSARRLLPGVSVLSPSISNLNGRGLDYLKEMVRHLPDDCGISFHRYPNGRDFDVPHRGFTSRFREVDALKELAGNRAIWCTENGWAEQNRDYQLSEEEVADRMEREHASWESAGCAAWTAYQINSAVIEADDDHDDRRLKTYGARRPDGSWKPWAERIKGVA